MPPGKVVSRRMKGGHEMPRKEHRRIHSLPHECSPGARSGTCAFRHRGKAATRVVNVQ